MTPELVVQQVRDELLALQVVTHADRTTETHTLVTERAWIGHRPRRMPAARQRRNLISAGKRQRRAGTPVPDHRHDRDRGQRIAGTPTQLGGDCPTPHVQASPCIAHVSIVPDHRWSSEGEDPRDAERRVCYVRPRTTYTVHTWGLCPA